MNRRRTGLATALAMLVLAAPADAALRFETCWRWGEARCATLRVPLDRSGALPGSIGLKVQVAGPRRPTRPPVVLLAGGPGQSAIRSFKIGFGFMRQPGRQVVAFDQRGTGASGLLRCRDLESANLFNAERQAAACQTLLGPRRHHYRTADTVADIEALRRELGVERIALVGISYGTYVAQAYAAAHPQNVERLVLDSVVDTTGVDPFYRDTIAAIRRNLRALCRRNCRRFTRDAVGDVARLVTRLAGGSVRGYVVTDAGKRRPAAIDRPGLLATLISADIDFVARAELPGALVSALRGDPAPLLRLQRRSVGGSGHPRDFSAAVYSATMCEEAPLPWPRSAPPGQRGAIAWRAAELIPRALLTPFDVATVSGSDLNRLCRRWVASPEAPAPIGPLPDVPALLLAGARDLRTPLEGARRVAARLPNGRLVVVRRGGHSLIGATACADRKLEQFMRGRRPGSRCNGGGAPHIDVSLPVAGPAPQSLRDLRPVAGTRGRTGRALAALEESFRDFGYQLMAATFSGEADRDPFTIPGLRGGRFTFRGDRREVVRMQSFEYIPGVRLSGRFGGEESDLGVIRLHGPRTPDGRLRFDERGIRGRIGGERVVIRGGLEPRSAIATAARVSRRVCPRIMGGWRARSSPLPSRSPLCWPRRLPRAPR